MQVLRSLTLMMLACTCLVLAGCNQDSTSPPVVDPSPFAPRDSPERLLENLDTAYELRNVVEYDSLLAEDFEFVLSEEDQAQPGLPDSWGRVVESGLHANLFSADLVNRLELSFEIGERFWDETASPPMWSIIISNVRLGLNGRTPGESVVMDFQIYFASAQFWFRENPWTADGSSCPAWSIVRWEDKGGGFVARGPESLSGQRATWGSIKSLFR